jgi:hypothetical protein
VASEDYKRDSALCAIGDGLGNVVEQTCMVQAVQSLYDSVDVWMPRSGEVCREALCGLEGLRAVSIDPKGAFLADHYDVGFFSFLMGPRFVRMVDATDVFKMPHPRFVRAPEAVIAVDLVREVGYEFGMPKPRCGWVPHTGKPFDRPLLGISTGGHPRPYWRRKRYQMWGKVVDYLHEKLPDLSMVLVGTKEDDPIERDFVMDLRDKLPFLTVAGIIRECDVFLSNDCGLGHVAAALDVPTFAVFGPTLLHKNTAMHNMIPIYHRRIGCRPCQYRKPKMGFRLRRGKLRTCKTECLKWLRPETIGNQVLRYLGYAHVCDHRNGPEWYEVLSPGDE